MKEAGDRFLRANGRIITDLIVTRGFSNSGYLFVTPKNKKFYLKQEEERDLVICGILSLLLTLGA